MPETWKRLAQTQPGTGAATVYTVPGSTMAIVKHIRAVNTGSAVANLKLFNGGTANVNVILPPTEIPVDQMLEMDVTLTLNVADTLAALATVATTISLSIYGVEIT